EASLTSMFVLEPTVLADIEAFHRVGKAEEEILDLDGKRPVREVAKEPPVIRAPLLTARRPEQEPHMWRDQPVTEHRIVSPRTGGASRDVPSPGLALHSRRTSARPWSSGAKACGARSTCDRTTRSRISGSSAARAASCPRESRNPRRRR